jgi:hypothetical protein
MWIKKRLLIWGTTYPEFSKKYYETVCTGALDVATQKLVRIYPIRLRHMKEPIGASDVGTCSSRFVMPPQTA